MSEPRCNKQNITGHNGTSDPRTLVKHIIPSHLPAVLMLGAASQIGQILLLREFLMSFHGNELSIGIILGTWLLWVGAGSRIGTVLMRKFDILIKLFLGSACGILLLLPITILFIRNLRGFFDMLPGAYFSLIDIAISCFILMAPTCLLLGMQFVFLAKIWRLKDQSADTAGAGKTYLGEATGNMLGGLFFTFLAVHYLYSLQTAVLVGVMMIAVAFLASCSSLSGLTKPRYLLIALTAILLLSLSMPFFEVIDQWAHRIQWQYFSPDHELISVHQSKYGIISILEYEGQYSFYQSGHLMFSTGGPESISSALEEQQAVTFTHFAMVQHRKPEKILLIGGGLRGILTEIIKHPVKNIDYVELDQRLTEAALPYISRSSLLALSDPRVNLLHTDGRLFLKTTDLKYDMILIDSPDPATAVLNRFYTREFFAEIRDALEPGGVLALGLISTADLRGTAIANRNATIYHTLNSVFRYVIPAGDQIIYYFAADKEEQITADITILQERYLNRNIETEGFSEQHFHTLLSESQLRRVNWIIRNHGRTPTAHLDGPEPGPLFPVSIYDQELQEKYLVPVEKSYFINSDLKPIGYYYTLMFWTELTRSKHGDLLKWLLHIKPFWIFPVMSIPLLLALAMLKIKRLHKKNSVAGFGIRFAVFTTGFSTMALQVALLFSFQSTYGFIYEIIGMIVAIFMGGLALGTYCANRCIVNKADVNMLTAVQLLIAIFAAIIAFIIPLSAAISYPVLIFSLFSVLTFLAGFVNGIDFPLSTACLMTLTKDAEKSTSAVYSIELAGACIGAVVASIVIVPIFGIVFCCLMAAIANGTAFVVLLISRGVYNCQLKKSATKI